MTNAKTFTRRFTAPLDGERCEAGIKHGAIAKEGARCMKRKVKDSDYCGLHQKPENRKA